MVVDRGFRDSISVMQECGLKVEMPAYLHHTEKQHTTKEANLSRLVTKVRWVVESANGRIKKWKFLDNVLPNSYLPFIGEYVAIVAAMCNAFRPDFVKQDTEDITVAEEMLKRAQTETNKVQKRVTREGLLSKRVLFEDISDDAACARYNFPQLSEDDLRRLAFGVYQLKQVQCYASQHHTADGAYTISAHRSSKILIHAKIQSRHTGIKVYHVFIQYRQRSIEPIVGWFCTCKGDARLVGCCAHFACVLWYLGTRHHDSQRNCPSKSSDLGLVDAGHVSDDATSGSELESVDESD